MRKLIILLVLMLGSFLSFANNVVISNVSIINNGPDSIQVLFNVSWDNSWRVITGQANYDGAWIFFKYKTAGGEWKHLFLTGNDNFSPAGSEIYQNTGPLKTGAMIYRSTTNLGSGSVNFTMVKLGVMDALPYDVDIKGFAVETVFIPPLVLNASGKGGGSITLGDGNGISESINAFHGGNNQSLLLSYSVPPASISYANIRVDTNVNDDATLYGTGIRVSTTGGIAGINSNFPIGKPIWCMKYEISQAGYRDFLNTLTLIQQTARTTTPPTSPTGFGALTGLAGQARTYIEIATPSAGGRPAIYGCDANANNIYNEADDGEWVACNYLNWFDLGAWLDWAGLAPMTEIDYERICRGFTSAGPNPSVFRECAWGTATFFGAYYIPSSISTAGETVSNASTTAGNANYALTNSFGGPSRVGIFATATSNRISSGSSFYGVMELTGNIVEACITVGNVAGRSFRGTNGDGQLDPNGNSNECWWPNSTNPNISSGCIVAVGAAGTINRGGGWFNDPKSVSDREGVTGFTVRVAHSGGRGVLYVK